LIYNEKRRAKEKNPHHNSLFHIIASDKMIINAIWNLMQYRLEKKKKIYGKLNHKKQKLTEKLKEEKKDVQCFLTEWSNELNVMIIHVV